MPEFNDLKLDALNFMPYYEIRFTKKLDESKFDVYDWDFFDKESSANASGWDVFIPMDYAKLSRYLRI